MSKTVLVTTTIRIPVFLRDVATNARHHEHTDFSCLVIGDTKTPAETAAFCEQVTRECGIQVTYLSLDDQRAALAEYPELWDLIPLNSGSRKQIGNFLAYLQGCETLIMLDDDNFLTAGDFVGFYQRVGQSVVMDLFEASSGWYNIYESLVEARGLPLYPRGFPWSFRVPSQGPVHRRRAAARIAVINGLVLEDPDVDAIARLFAPIEVVGLRPEFEPQFGLMPGTWAPFNNQNTALAREIVPVFFTPPSTGRNADIWTSYVICRLTEHAGQVIAFGQPLVRQIRNPHNLWKDLEDERLNNRATDSFVQLLREVPLTERTYAGALEELLDGCVDRLPFLSHVADDEREMMEAFLSEYKTWMAICSEMVSVD